MFTSRSLAKWLVAGLLLSFFSAAAMARMSAEDAARSNKGYMVLPAPLQVPPGKTAQDVKDAIFKGLAVRGWTGKEIAPDVIEANFDKNGKHALTVDLKYNANDITMTYKNSVNLKYQVVFGEARLHHLANGWMQNLLMDIGNALDR